MTFRPGHPDDADNRPDEWDTDEHLARRHPYIDGAWGRTANPNTADGELQNAAAFASGFSRLEGGQRTFARAIVWLILLGFATSILFAIAAIVRIW